jgi:hypothetical protein
MEWFVLIFLVPLILVPIVLLCGFAGCGYSGLGTGVGPSVAAPSGLSATATGVDEIVLNWQNNTGGPTNFSIERAPSASSSFPEIGQTALTTFTDKKQLGLVEGTTYLYRVRVKISSNPFGGVPCDVVTVTTFPATPTNLVGTPVGTNQVQLSWNNASATATKFSLEHRPNPGSGWNEIFKGTAKTSPPTPLTPAGSDEYRVTAIVDGYDNNVKKEVRSIPSAPISGVTEIPITPPTWKTAYGVALTVDDPGFAGDTIVQRIDASHLTNAGIKVRITVRGSTAANLIINKVTISQAAAAGQLWNSAADLIEVRFGGASGVTIPANTSKISDETNYNLVLGKDLIVAFDINATNGAARRAVLAGPVMYSKKNTAEASLQNRTGNYTPHANSVYIVEKIEVS